MQRLTLIGMPGSGKSAVGRIVAERLGWDFVDTDLCIEKGYACKLQEVVDRVGVEEFRRIEEQAVLALAPQECTVISTGGSVVYSEPAMRHLRALSTVVFLNVPIQVLNRHIAKDAPRGIVGMDGRGMEGLNEERFPLYLKYAHLVVMLHGESPDEAADSILSRLHLTADTVDGR